MKEFAAAFIGAAVIVLAMTGWGWALARIVRLQRQLSFGFCAAAGFSFSLVLETFVGGVKGSIWQRLVPAYLAAGLLLGLIALCLEWKPLRNEFSLGLQVLSRRVLAAAGIASIGFILLLKVCVAIGPVWTMPDAANPSSGPLAAVVRETGSHRVMDFGIAFVILILLLAELMKRNAVAAVWSLLILFAVTLETPIATSPLVFTAVLLFVLVFDLIGGSSRQPFLGSAVMAAIAFAALISLGPAYALLSAALWAAGLLLRQGMWKQALVCAAVTGVFTLPELRHGFTGPVAGTAYAGMTDIFNMSHGTEHTLYVIFLLLAAMLLWRRAWRNEWTNTTIVSVGIVGALPMVLFGDNAFTACSFTFVFAAVAYLLIQDLATQPLTPATDGRRNIAVPILLTGVLLGNAAETFILSEREWLLALKASVTGHL